MVTSDEATTVIVVVQEATQITELSGIRKTMCVRRQNYHKMENPLYAPKEDYWTPWVAHGLSPYMFPECSISQESHNTIVIICHIYMTNNHDKLQQNSKKIDVNLPQSLFSCQISSTCSMWKHFLICAHTGRNGGMNRHIYIYIYIYIYI